ncbi:MAG: hypothetical protein HWN65_11460 [Candidatus Helarchaeota archaeon]|nr:hypothetical protein [Candidatus Helarchaeota archaeon]
MSVEIEVDSESKKGLEKLAKDSGLDPNLLIKMIVDNFPKLEGVVRSGDGSKPGTRIYIIDWPLHPIIFEK